MIDKGMVSSLGNDSEELKQSITNWNKTAEILYSTEDQEVVLQLLHAEIKYFNRPYNRDRIYSRFSHLRRQAEWGNLEAFINAFRRSIPAIEAIAKEYDDRRRPYVLKKLYGFFTTQRSKTERKFYGLTE